MLSLPDQKTAATSKEQLLMFDIEAIKNERIEEYRQRPGSYFDPSVGAVMREVFNTVLFCGDEPDTPMTQGQIAAWRDGLSAQIQDKSVGALDKAYLIAVRAYLDHFEV